MSQSDSVIALNKTLTLYERLCRQVFLKALSFFEDGNMTIMEQGQKIAEFGKSSDLHAVVNILSPSAYPKLLFGGSIGAGEAYMDGLWNSPDLTHVIQMFARNLPTLDKWEDKLKWLKMPWWKIQHFLNNNTPIQAKRNIEAHYDLGNKLYTQFLDETMMYSAAIYPDSNTSLNQAQIYKLDTICQKLKLCKDDHLLEIGTGWGGLAVHAAKHYGCKVTTTTISEEQHDWARDWINKENLNDKITLLKKD